MDCPVTFLCFPFQNEARKTFSWSSQAVFRNSQACLVLGIVTHLAVRTANMDPGAREAPWLLDGICQLSHTRQI